MSRKLVQNNSISLKDESGAYLPVFSPIVSERALIEDDLSIDTLLQQGLLGISRAMKALNTHISSGIFDIDHINMLKACMSMLHELKKKEDELIEDMSDEQLEKLANVK